MIYLSIIVVIILSAFFSGMELAFLTSDRLRLELDRDKGGVTGRLLGMLFRRPDDYVTTMLVGNNIALVIYGLLMAQLLIQPLTALLRVEWLVILGQSLLSTFVILFLGEFLPKVTFRTNPNRTMKMMTVPVTFFYILLWPITKICTLLTWLFFLIIGHGKNKVDPQTLTTADLDNYLSENFGDVGNESDLDTEVKIIQNALDFKSVQLRNCMIPRNEMITVEIGAAAEELEAKFISTGLSKIVVYRDNIDDVLGYIHSSQMFREGNWSDHILPTIFAPESMYANKLMQQLMHENKSIAIIIDEMGGTAGMITLEDVVEEIFGDIEDEHDRNKLIAKQIAERTYMLSGRMEIDDINETFSLDLPESEDYMTIAGFILHHHQHIPSIGEKVRIAPYTFDILRATSTRIVLVKLTYDSEEFS